MHSVPLPDPVYTEAAQYAAAIGLDVDAYIVEAVKQRIEEEKPVRLTAAQIEICDRAAADIKAGKFFTSEQVRAHFDAKHTAWTKNQQP